MAHVAVLGIVQRLSEFQSATLTRMRPGQRQAFLEHDRPAPRQAAHDRHSTTRDGDVTRDVAAQVLSIESQSA